jgi:hypothetical protein
VHRVVRFDERALWNRSPPRVRYEDAVLEVASQAGSDVAAFAVLADGCRTRHTTASRLADTLAARPRVRRRAWLTGVLADLSAGSTSVLEHSYVTRVQRAHGLPRAAQQVRSTSSVGVVYRDVEYIGVLVVELDGRLVHNTAARRDADFERDLDSALDGRATVRLSWGQVIDRPCTTASKISQLLQRHGWSGRPIRAPPLPVDPVSAVDPTWSWRRINRTGSGRDRGDRQAGGLPRPEPAGQVGGVVQAQILQRRRGQTRAVALRADDDPGDVVVDRLRYARGRGGVQPPLQVVALDHQRIGQLALLGALPARTGVHQDRAGIHQLRGPLRAGAIQPGPGRGQQFVHSGHPTPSDDPDSTSTERVRRNRALGSPGVAATS